MMKFEFSEEEAKLLRMIAGWYANSRHDFFSALCKKDYRLQNGKAPSMEYVNEQRDLVKQADDFAERMRKAVKL